MLSESGARGLFGCHDRPFVPQVLSIIADKIANTVTAVL